MIKPPFKAISIVLVIALFFIALPIVFSQERIENLLEKLRTAPEIEQSNILNQLSEINSENASDKAIQYAESALILSRKYKDKRNEAFALQNLCLGYLYNDIYDKALVNGLAALDIFEELKKPKDLAYILSTLGWVYYDIQNADLALKYHQKVLTIYLELEEKDNIAFAYNSLGLVYSMKEEYEQALTFYLKSLKLGEENKLKHREAAACSNLGMTYASLESYDLALSYLQKALDLIGKNGTLLSKAEAWNQKGKVYLKTKQFIESEKCLKKARELITKSTSNANKEKLMDNYEYSSELFFAKGDFKKAYEAVKEYTNIRNTVLSDEKTSRLSEMRLLYETEKREHEIGLLEKQKKIERLILIASIVGFLFFLILGYLTYTKLKNKHQKVQLTRQNLKDKLDFKNNELTTFALHVAQRNELLSKFIKALSNIKKNANETTAIEIKKLAQQIEQSQMVNQDLEAFHLNVENVHKDFFYNLNKKYPSLTENEKRLAAQLRLNLSNKDIAALNNTSNKSVEMARYRLRKKLELDSKANLHLFFQQF